MKFMISAIPLVCLLCASPVFASADLELKSIKTNIGKGAITSGYDVVMSFANNKSCFDIIGNHSRVYVVYQPNWNKYVKLAASGGFYKNMPWIGPRVIFCPVKWLSSMHWYAVSAGEPEAPDWNVSYMIRYNDVAVTIGNFRLSYALSGFMDEELKNLPGVAYIGKLNPSWSFSVSTDYNLNDHEPLFMIGLKQVF